MRFTSVLTFVVGVAIAGSSALMARNLIEDRGNNQVKDANPALVNVIIASNDIAFGQAIEPHMLRTIDWPSDAVPAGTYSAYSNLLPEDGQQPRRARQAIGQGELVLASKVSDYGEKVTIVQTLGPNRRAMAIKVSAETAVGGFVTPGDFVDVILTQGRDDALRAVTILQNIRVIGVDQQADEQSDTPEVARTVTVEVTPQDGQRLALAQKAGILSLSLRTLSASDEEDIPLDTIKLSDVLRDPEPEAEPVRQRQRTIVVRRGTEISETEVN